MDIDAWLSQFGSPADAGSLASPDSAALIKFLQRHGEHVARVVEVRSAPPWELVVLDFQTGKPQQSFYPIKRCERIGVRFSVHGSMPLVYMLRSDFPDTEHQQLTIEGSPRAICIDDRPWAEARLTWTPAELVHRILSWFSRAIRGELHDSRQPIDPVLSGSSLSFLISRRLLAAADELDLVGVHNTAHRQTLRVIPTADLSGEQNLEPVCVVAYRVKPEHMTRMRFAPGNLGSLAEVLSCRGIDLLEDLTSRLSDWLAEGKEAAWRLNARFVIVVEMPIISPHGDLRDGTDLRAYVTAKSAGDIAVALGIASSATAAQGSGVGFVRVVGETTPDEQAVRELAIDVAEIHYEFDRELATQLAGRTQIDSRRAVMIGAGAIGSHVSDCLVREGRYLWTIVDDDYLLPHNLARHTAHDAQVTQNKAQTVARDLNAVYRDGSQVAAPIAANAIFCDDAERSQIENALAESKLIIDASASVLVERFLSDHSADARRASIFFTPSGNAAVLLVEPADRSCTLRDLEAQYLALVAGDDSLSSHLQAPAGSFAYTGACRAVTNTIPESRVLTLSGLVAAGLGEAADQREGVVKVWSVRENGAVDVRMITPQPVHNEVADAWTITVDDGVITSIMRMRRARLPNETGGILFGVVDIPCRRIHIVGADPAPPDSKETATGFVRGVQGVEERIDDVSNRTNTQVRYVGEWHSHPPRVAPVPSSTDLAQIDWLATMFDMDTLPALMIIAGDRNVSVILANKLAAPVDTRSDDGERDTHD